MKKNKTIERIFFIFIGMLLAMGLNVLADACTTTLSSTEITYGSTDVKSALDELYAVNTGTAGASQVLTGYTFSNDSDIGVAGTMANNGAVSESVGVGGSYTIPAGYHNGSGTVTGPTLSGNAAVANVLKDKTFYSNSGTKLTGTMPDNSTRTSNGSVPGISSNYSNVPTREASNLQMNTDTSGTKRISMCPPTGYYPGGGLSYVNRPASDFGNASASDVVSGKTFTSTAGIKVTGTGSGSASWVQVWSGSTTGNISVSLSAYKYVVVQVTGGSWLMLQVGGSKGYIGYIGTSPDGMWGTWGGTRAYKATTSGITSDSDLYGATENKGKSWISITKVWGIKNLN